MSVFYREKVEYEGSDRVVCKKSQKICHLAPYAQHIAGYSPCLGTLLSKAYDEVGVPFLNICFND